MWECTLSACTDEIYIVHVISVQGSAWVPVLLRRKLNKWLQKVLDTTQETLHVGQIGILFGKAGLPLQDQHRDNEKHHVVFLTRCTRPRADLRKPISHLSRLGPVWLATSALIPTRNMF